MHEVTVRRDELIAKIRANRAEHRTVFLEAQEGYRRAVIEELDRMLEDAREGRKIRRAIGLPEPQDHTDDYDRVLAMLEMSVDDTVTLDAGSFAQYVLDQWSWKHQFDVTNSSYGVQV